ncbi:MAG: GNAT family N-acetyltransferase [Anaerolineae bacterium]|jgi:ribosomal protein S18 acetylase RimI-like enzyme
MGSNAVTVVRAFDGSLDDAKGLLAVEQATFDESRYSAEQVRTMLSDGPQHAWLALGGDRVIGFVIAFRTDGLAGAWWEIDLVAVHPAWRGRGLASRLVRAAAAHGAQVAHRTRAVVAADNSASARAFTRTGFRMEPQVYELLIYRPEDRKPRSRIIPGVTIHKTSSLAQAAEWMADSEARRNLSGVTLLLSEPEGGPVGYAELIKVQTLLYRGVWIESLVASTQTAKRALICRATDWARVRGLDEIGMMVPGDDQAVQELFLGADFRSLGTFRWLTAELPLPGLASARPSEPTPR